MKRLYVAVSHHGLGHLAQTAAVLDALHALDPTVGLVVRSALPEGVLKTRLAMPFEYLGAPADCNLVMHDAVRVDQPASLDAYRAFHRDWQRKVEREAEQLAALRVDALYSNVGYLPLAAAQRAGLPAVALCSLNWADIFRHYLGNTDGAETILAQMTAAYAGAGAFLRPQPSMPMADLANTVPIPPVAQPGRDRRAELKTALGLASDDKIVAISMGGIPYRLPAERWPRLPGVVFLVPDGPAHPPAVRMLSEAGMPFRDLLASADALITKPGYGSYTEAALGGVPVLSIPRPDWPETAWLGPWLRQVGRALEIGEAKLAASDLAEPLAALWALPAKPPPATDGARVAAGMLLDRLRPGRSELPRGLLS